MLGSGKTLLPAVEDQLLYVFRGQGNQDAPEEFTFGLAGASPLVRHVVLEVRIEQSLMPDP